MTAYVFVFTGEFGYELLNWQGVVRYFARNCINDDDKVVCCSRRGLHLLYEFADLYIDISNLNLFKNSVADMYYSELDRVYFKESVMDSELNDDDTLMENILADENQSYRKRTEDEILEYASGIVKKAYPDAEQDFVFSSRREMRNGVQFSVGGIYRDLDLVHNCFVQIRQDDEKEALVRSKLPFDLNNDYILVQTGKRRVVVRSKESIMFSKLLEKLSKRMKVLLLDFDTGRLLDSNSNWQETELGYQYHCQDFSEQSVLINNSKKCVFLTEGDFRSHNYIPPFMGKDVYSIADQTVYDLPTSPLDFWNENVFTYGGQIIPIVYKRDNFMKEDYCEKLAEKICNGE